MSWSGWKPRNSENSRLPESGHLYADWLFSQRRDWLRSQGIDQAKSIEPSNFFDGKFDVKKLYGGILAPGFMRNDSKLSPQETITNRLPLLHRDTVIVGVIDTGIALGHRSTRLSDGTTRFIAAWQQSAARKTISGDEFPNQSHLPFGRELFTDDINTLLETHSIGGLEDGWLDEEAFDRAAGLVDFYNPLGHRELARRTAHGTHVLGRAAGYDLAQDPTLAKFADRIRIIAINLPSRSIVGLSGSFLEQYVGLGIARIDRLANLLVTRAKQEPDVTGVKEEDFHYKVIVNLSFGKQAGSRDGEEPIAKSISNINGDSESIAPIDRGGIFFAIPAGNDNLLQGNAIITLSGEEELKPGDEKRELKWRILPEDQTPNYVEIWSEPIKEKLSDIKSFPLEISMELPNRTLWSGLRGDEAWEDLSKEKKGEDSKEREFAYFNEIEQVVRVYCKLQEIDSKYRLHYLICVAPTIVTDSSAPTAPAGVWKITLENRLPLKNKKHQPLKFYANVQTDQSAVPSGITGLRSYFEDKAYMRVDETTGRLLDTYPYPDDEESALARAKLDWRKGSFDLRYLGHDKEESAVKRHGTLNALAINRRYSIMVGGYRATDGMPVPYSATGGDFIGTYMGAPTLALVTDDGPAHPGILSEGSRDGSAVAMRGTSFAAPQITKKIAELLVNGETDLNPKTWINAQSRTTYAAGEISRNERRYPQGIDIDKGGRGRFPQSHYRGLNRLGLETDD